jgi:hypothetical protein
VFDEELKLHSAFGYIIVEIHCVDDRQPSANFHFTHLHMTRFTCSNIACIHGWTRRDQGILAEGTTAGARKDSLFDGLLTFARAQFVRCVQTPSCACVLKEASQYEMRCSDHLHPSRSNKISQVVLLLSLDGVTHCRSKLRFNCGLLPTLYSVDSGRLYLTSKGKSDNSFTEYTRRST